MYISPLLLVLNPLSAATAPIYYLYIYYYTQSQSNAFGYGTLYTTIRSGSMYPRGREINTIIYRITTRRSRKTSTIIYKSTTWSRRKNITHFCIPASIIFFLTTIRKICSNNDILLLVLQQIINCDCLWLKIMYVILCYYPLFYHIYIR